MNVVVFGLGALISLSFGISDFLSKGVTRKIGAYRTTVYVLAIGGVATLLPGFVLRSSFDFSPLSVSLVLFIAVSMYVSNLSLYKAYSKGMLSITSPIANSYPAFSAVLSVLLIGASFSLGSGAALLVVVIGIALVSTNISSLRQSVLGQGKGPAPGVGWAIVAMIFFGAGWTAFGFATETFGFLLPAIAIRLGAAGLGLGLAPFLKEDVKPAFGGTLPRLCVMSALEAAGAILFSLGAIVSAAPDAVPILATFSGMSAAFTVLLAVAFLREKLDWNHVAGIAMLLAGVLALLYLGG